jgi:hypothetical protein
MKVKVIIDEWHPIYILASYYGLGKEIEMSKDELKKLNKSIKEFLKWQDIIERRLKKNESK